MTKDNEWAVERVQSTALKMVSNAGISSKHIANGRNIPLIILDTTQNKDIEDAILFHESVQNGHVRTIWGKTLDGMSLLLEIDLTDPIPKDFMVFFDVVKDAFLIDRIIKTQLLYIQPGKRSDRFGNTMNNPRLQIEVPSSHFENEWIKIFNNVYIKHFKEKGMKEKDAVKATKDMYNKLNDLEFRIK